jgi:hypothetical protein
MIEIDVIDSAAPKYLRYAILAALALLALPEGVFAAYFSISIGQGGAIK